jgi:hypothetical protein
MTITKRKAELREWLQILVAGSKSVLSSSANNHSILNGAPRQSSSETMYVYGGLTRVSLMSNNSFVERDASNYDLAGDGMLVGTPTGDRVGQLHKVPSRRFHRMHTAISG